MVRGWKTSEFWVTTLATVGACLAAIADIIPPRYAVFCAAIAQGAYAISRGLAKVNPPK